MIKENLAVFSAKTASAITRFFGREGLALPGKIACKIDPNILKKLAKKYKIILVTGTNGKTQTTAIAHSLVEDSITNEGGANLYQGIVSAFLKSEKEKKSYAIIECDEAVLARVCEEISVEYIIITNIFEDQKDRFPSAYHTMGLLEKGILLAEKATIIINEDNLLASALSSSSALSERRILRVGSSFHNPKEKTENFCPLCGHKVSYKSKAYDEVGDHFCTSDSCSAKRGPLDIEIHHFCEESLCFSIGEENFDLPSLSGIHGVYNFALAYALMIDLGISREITNQQIPAIFGRNKVFTSGDRKIFPYLIKNKSGGNRILNQIKKEKGDYRIFFFLNANYADGKNTDWVKELSFEGIKGELYIGGKEIETLRKLFPEAKNATIEEIFTMREKTTYVLGNYTALMPLKAEFKKYFGDA